MKNIHPEFAYQSRELGVQIEDTLGEPPDRKYYAKVIRSLIDEFAAGAEFNDVNLLSFALADFLQFNNVKGLLAQCDSYDKGDIEEVLSMVSCSDEKAGEAITRVAQSNPTLARCAILTAFLYKNPKRWVDEDHTLESLQRSEEGEIDDEEQPAGSYDIEQLFDSNGDKNDR
jgi:hypothetical protein